MKYFKLLLFNDPSCVLSSENVIIFASCPRLNFKQMLLLKVNNTIISVLNVCFIIALILV